jgi:hypothetical protein
MAFELMRHPLQPTATLLGRNPAGRNDKMGEALVAKAQQG